MKRKHKRNVGRIVFQVAAAHLLLVLAVLIVPWLRRRFRKPPPLIIPIELNLAMAAPAPDIPPVPVPEPAPETDTMAPTNRPPPEPDPEPVRERPRIEVSQERVVRRRDPEPPDPPALTPEQLRQLLADTMASETGVRPAGADDDRRDLELIRQTLYRSWSQPSGHHLRGRVTVVSLRLDPRGTIMDYEIDRASGDTEMDRSVRAAMESVRRIPGLSSGFAARRQRVTVYFELAD